VVRGFDPAHSVVSARGFEDSNAKIQVPFPEFFHKAALADGLSTAPYLISNT